MFKAICLPALFFLLSLGSCTAAAQAEPDFFQPEYDKSSEMVRMLFGEAWMEAVFDGEAGATSGASAPLYRSSAGGIAANGGGVLGVITEVLVLVSLAAALLIISISGTTAAINSAYEGVALGKNYHGFWMPMRTVIAVALLIPWSNGYSLAHYGFFKVVGASIATANAAYTRAVDYVGDGFGVANIVPAADNSKYLNLVVGMVSGEGCAMIRNQTPGLDGSAGGRIQFNSDSLRAATGDVVGFKFSYDPVGSDDAGCGGFAFNIPAAGVRPAQRAAANQGLACINTAVQNTRPAAAALAASVLSTQFPPASQMRIIAASLSNAVSACEASYTDAVLAAAPQRFAAAELRGQPVETVMRESGWLYAGGYYWTITKMTSEANKGLQVSIDVDPDVFVSLIDSGISSSEQSEIQARAAVLKSYLLKSQQTMRAVERASEVVTSQGKYLENKKEPSTLAGVLASKVSSWWQGLLRDAAAGTTNAIFGAEGDPLLKMSQMGHSLLTIYGVSKSVTAGASGIVGAAQGGAAGSVLGPAGTVAGGAIGGVKGVVDELTDVSPLGMAMVSIGGFLAYWLPAIPWMLWIASVTGWLIMLVLSALSIPIWAASHAFPEGDGWAGQQARNGYMLILSAFLRPILMIAGFFAGMIIVQVVGWLVFGMSELFISDILGADSMSLFSVLAQIILMGAVIVGTAYRAFDLSFEAADSVLKWIGGGVEQLGDRSTLDQSRAMLSAFIAKSGISANPNSGRDTKGRFKPAVDYAKQKLGRNSVGKSSGA